MAMGLHRIVPATELDVDTQPVGKPAVGTAVLASGGLAKTRFRFYMAMVTCDLVAIWSGFLAASLIKLGPDFPDYAWSFAIGVSLIYLLAAGKAYSADALANWQKGAALALGALTIAFATMLFFGVALKSSEIVSRIWLALSFVSITVLLAIGRASIGTAANKTFKEGTWSRLLISDGIDLAVPVGVERFDASDIALGEGSPHPLVLDEIGRRVQGYDSVIICSIPERRRAWARALQGCDVPIHILIPELDDLGLLDIEQFEGIPMIVVSAGPLKLREKLAKRAFDLAITLPMLLAALPIFIITAIAIRIDSPGPILFRQQRVGRGNRLFDVLKFRSMYQDRGDKNGDVSAVRNDDRITRVGRFIRATSIDELPQLLNVLRGEMSLVGPRPHALGSLAGDKLFWELDSRYHIRHSCKPGLTGLAQIRGFRGATERREDLLHRLDADLEYRSTWSVWRDLAILIATVRVLVHKNAF